MTINYVAMAPFRVFLFFRAKLTCLVDIISDFNIQSEMRQFGEISRNLHKFEHLAVGEFVDLCQWKSSVCHGTLGSGIVVKAITRFW